MNEQKYFKAICLGGHKGGSNEGELSFALKAADIVAAYKKARSLPCVKHTRCDAVQSVKEITKEEYLELRKTNAYSRYFNH